MFSDAAIRAIESGKKIAAVRMLTQETGCSMDEALVLIEQYKAQRAGKVVTLPETDPVTR